MYKYTYIKWCKYKNIYEKSNSLSNFIKIGLRIILIGSGSLGDTSLDHKTPFIKDCL